MVYEYRCTRKHCQKSFDVTKLVKDMDVNEYCPKCGEPAERQFVPSKVYFSGTRVEHAEYNPGLGQIVKNKQHRDELAKRMGVVEIGNDYKSADSLQKTFEKVREDKRIKRWEDD